MPEVTPGQSWRCDEGRADAGDVPDGHDVPLWEAHPRFTAVVDDILDGVAELTVSGGNSHPRTPDFGATLDIHVDTLTGDRRWEIQGSAAANGGDA